MDASEGQRPLVLPVLAYADADAAMSWLCRVFRFTEVSRMVGRDGRVAIADLRTSAGGSIMIGSIPPRILRGLVRCLTSRVPTTKSSGRTRSLSSFRMSTPSSSMLVAKEQSSALNRPISPGVSATSRRSTSWDARGTSASTSETSDRRTGVRLPLATTEPRGRRPSLLCPYCPPRVTRACS